MALASYIHDVRVSISVAHSRSDSPRYADVGGAVGGGANRMFDEITEKRSEVEIFVLGTFPRGEFRSRNPKVILLCKLQFRCDELEMGRKVPGFLDKFPHWCVTHTPKDEKPRCRFISKKSYARKMELGV